VDVAPRLGQDERGYLDAAAVAGFIKTIRRSSIARSAEPPLTRPNPRIRFAGTPFYVNARLRPWESEGVPRRAGVSSFGIGGTNAHVNPRGASPAGALRPRARRPGPGPVGGERAGARRLSPIDRGSARIEPRIDLADAAFTSRWAQEASLQGALVARDAAEVIASLRRERARRDGAGRDRFLFPGQDRSTPGMARASRAPTGLPRGFRSVAATLRPILASISIRRLPRAGPTAAEDRLRDTSLAQPALFSVEYASRASGSRGA